MACATLMQVNGVNERLRSLPYRLRDGYFVRNRLRQATIRVNTLKTLTDGR